MFKYLLIYGVASAILTVLWFQLVCKGCPEQDVESLARDSGATKKQVITLIYILLVLFGWVWFPYAIIRSIINRLKGNK